MQALSGWNGRQVLVTGAAGFLGGHVASALQRAGAHVRAVDNLDAPRPDWKRVLERCEVRKLDIRDQEAVADVVQGCEFVFHLAANASVPRSVEDPSFDMSCNVQGTLNVLEAARRANVASVVSASSAAVYGTPERYPMTVGDRTRPISPYGASKLAAEHYANVYRSMHGMRISIVRIFNCYGEGQTRYVMFDLTQKLLRDPTHLKVLGTGAQKRDYCHAQDAARAFALLAQKGDGTYNLSGGSVITIAELAHRIASRIAPNARIEFGGKTWPGDIDALVADASELRALGFSPEIGLEEGIDRLVAWIRAEAGGLAPSVEG